jgi:hypothetical protein
MKRDIEYISHSDDDRLAFLENKTVELERRLAEVTNGSGTPEYHAREHGPVEIPAFPAPTVVDYADSGRRRPGADGTRHQGRTGHRDDRAVEATGSYPVAAGGYRDVASRYPDVAGDHPDAHDGYGDAHDGYSDAGDGYADLDDGYAEADDDYGEEAPVGYPDEAPVGYPGEAAGGYRGAGSAGYAGARAGGPGRPRERTEGIINHGRRHARRGRGWLAHWRAIAIAVVALVAGITLITLVLPGGSPGWPASVTTVQNEITIACQNPNVASEPSQVDFACAKATRQILWVFSLLSSDDNPNFTDSSNSRKGLEPIQPAQGGNIAWSLNLHHPYNPANPIDSLEVAARAINNIIGGATVTGTSGAPVVQSGLESSPANCATYTGSSALITRQGFPAVCALPVSSPAGQAALVSAVFQQWMVGAPAQFATEAGVLFENADNPGDPRVQSILSTLRTSGL